MHGHDDGGGLTRGRGTSRDVAHGLGGGGILAHGFGGAASPSSSSFTRRAPPSSGGGNDKIEVLRRGSTSPSMDRAPLTHIRPQQTQILQRGGRSCPDLVTVAACVPAPTCGIASDDGSRSDGAEPG